MLPHVLVFYANKIFFSLLKKAEQHLTGIYLMSPFATRIIRLLVQDIQTHGSMQVGSRVSVNVSTPDHLPSELLPVIQTESLVQTDHKVWRNIFICAAV
jgi:hypothetical protein